MPSDRLSLDKSDRKIIERIESENYFNFGNKTRKEQFLFVMAIGMNSEIERSPISTKEPWFHDKDLHPEDYALMIACAIKDTKSVDVVTEVDKIYKIAEEYAHIGVKVLIDKIDSFPFGSFEKQFEIEVSEMFDELGLI